MAILKIPKLSDIYGIFSITLTNRKKPLLSNLLLEPQKCLQKVSKHLQVWEAKSKNSLSTKPLTPISYLLPTHVSINWIFQNTHLKNFSKKNYCLQLAKEKKDSDSCDLFYINLNVYIFVLFIKNFVKKKIKI